MIEARIFSYMDMGDWASLQRDLRYPCDGSRQVASLWDRALSRRGTHNRISMDTYFSVCLTAPCEVRRITRNQECVFQSYQELLTALTKISGQSYLNLCSSNSVRFFVVHLAA